MIKKPLLLIPAMALLASCNGGNVISSFIPTSESSETSSNVPASESSATSSSFAPGSSSEVYSDPTSEPTSEVSSDPTSEPTSEVSSDPTSEPTSEVSSDPTSEVSSKEEAVFPEAELKAFLEAAGYGEYVIPSYVADNYEFISGIEDGYLYFEVYSSIEDEDQGLDLVDAIFDALSEDWEVNPLYYYWLDMVYATNYYGDVSVMAGIDGETDLYFYLSVTIDPNALEEAFPAEAIAGFLTSLEVEGLEIPAFEADCYSSYINFPEDEEDAYYFGVTGYFHEDREEKAMALENTYLAALKEDGWDIDDSEYDESGYFATKEGFDNVDINFYGWEGRFYVYIDEVVPEEEILPEGVELSFATEDALTTKDAKESVWTAEGFTFTVEKGESTVNVGNEKFFANPLRVYANQLVTISAEDAFDTLYFVCGDPTDKYDFVENLLYSLPEDADVSYGGLVVEVDFDEAINEFEFEAGSQLRFDSLFVSFVEAE